LKLRINVSQGVAFCFSFPSLGTLNVHGGTGLIGLQDHRD